MKTVKPRLLLLPILSFLPLLAGAAAEPAGGVLTVAVHNVRAAGTVYVDICTQAHFLKEDCAVSGDAPARPGTTMVAIRDLPPGRYAAQVFLDENRNGKVDRALFGIPREGVGFSNDAKISFGPPKFADAVFAFDGRAQTIQLKLRYFLGPKGPDEAR
jgi:uncharacterized protein (DUF2141 family)